MERIEVNGSNESMRLADLDGDLERKQVIEEAVRDILTQVGEDPERQGLEHRIHGGDYARLKWILAKNMQSIDNSRHRGRWVWH